MMKSAKELGQEYRASLMKAGMVDDDRLRGLVESYTMGAMAGMVAVHKALLDLDIDVTRAAFE